jgi:hypothetical protein
MKTHELISPFQGLVSWRCHYIVRCLMLDNEALKGQAPTGLYTLGWGNALSYTNRIMRSPEGAEYANEAVPPLAIKNNQIPKSPKGAEYINAAASPLANKNNQTPKSPVGAEYANEAASPLANKNNQTPKSPVGA